MKKFPFSKKAMNLMLATALLVTPLASVVPVGGTAVVEAATKEVKLVDHLNAKIKDKDTTIQKMTYDIVDILLTTNANEAELKTAVNEFRTKYSDAFHDIFKDELKVDDFFVVLNEFHCYVIDKYSGKNAIELFEIVNNAGGYKNFLIDNVNALAEENDDVANFQKTLEKHTGLTLERLIEIKQDIDKEIGLTTAEQLQLLYFMLDDDLKAIIRDADNSEVSDVDELISRIVEIYNSIDDKYKEPFREARQELNIIVEDAGSIEEAFEWDEIFDYVTIEVNTGGSGGGGGTTPPPTGTGTSIDNTTSKENGVTTVDTAKLQQLLNGLDKVDKVSLTIEAAAGQVAQAKIPVAAFDAIAAKNPNAVVEITSSQGTLRLPVAEINKDKIAQKLGVPAGTEITITVSVNKVEDTNNVVSKNKLNKVANVIEFEIIATAGDKKIELNGFSQYLEREINGSANFNAAKSSVIRLNPDGTFTAVPSAFNGDKATFRSFTNSKYTVVENEATFSDVKAGYWAKATIDKLASKYIVKGNHKGDFAPTKTTTRAEFATLLTRSLGLSTAVTYKGQFKDVKGSEWFVKDLVAAVEAGVIKGHANGKFGYNDPVTREEAAVMIARALTLAKFDTSKLNTSVDASKFPDANKVSSWAKDSVDTLVQLEITEGRPSGFAPKSGTQRAEMATLLERFLVKVNFMN